MYIVCPSIVTVYPLKKLGVAGTALCLKLLRSTTEIFKWVSYCSIKAIESSYLHCKRWWKCCSHTHTHTHTHTLTRSNTLSVPFKECGIYPAEFLLRNFQIFLDLFSFNSNSVWSFVYELWTSYCEIRWMCWLQTVFFKENIWWAVKTQLNLIDNLLLVKIITDTLQ